MLGQQAGLAQTGGVGSGRAEATGARSRVGTGFFNLAAFTAPPPGEFGDAGRNTIPGPPGGAERRVRPLVPVRRFAPPAGVAPEANNVLNQVNYTNIDTVVNATNYGLPISAGLDADG